MSPVTYRLRRFCWSRTRAAAELFPKNAQVNYFTHFFLRMRNSPNSGRWIIIHNWVSCSNKFCLLGRSGGMTLNVTSLFNSEGFAERTLERTGGGLLRAAGGAITDDAISRRHDEVLYNPYTWGPHKVGYMFLPRYVLPGLLFNVEVFFPIASGIFHPIFFFTGFQGEQSTNLLPIRSMNSHKPSYILRLDMIIPRLWVLGDFSELESMQMALL